ncbi:uncharacterized protein DS421_7g216280 [Arachis hypogaea]|nr:uncharacterized protein DS421_7g216280 [Arachis hypogaea]
MARPQRHPLSSPHPSLMLDVLERSKTCYPIQHVLKALNFLIQAIPNLARLLPKNERFLPLEENWAFLVWPTFPLLLPQTLVQPSSSPNVTTLPSSHVVWLPSFFSRNPHLGIDTNSKTC